MSLCLLSHFVCFYVVLTRYFWENQCKVDPNLNCIQGYDPEGFHFSNSPWSQYPVNVPQTAGWYFHCLTVYFHSIFILISPNRMISLISQTAPPLVAFLSVVPSALWTLDKNMQNESLLYQTQDYLTVSAYSYTSDSLTWGVQELFGYLSSLFVASFSAICRFLNHPLYFLEDSRTWFSVLFLVNKDPQRSSFSYMLVT